MASQGLINFEATTKTETKEIKQGILSGKYKGLGSICVMAMFLNENDFKWGNIVLIKQPDGTAKFIKIDGGQCFYEFILSKKVGIALSRVDDYEITEANIASLPFPNEYDVTNWLDCIIVKKHFKSQILTNDMCTNLQLRSEVNEVILKILIMPDVLISAFISNYISDLRLIAQLTNFIFIRKQDLYDAALNNRSFREYIFSKEATSASADFVNDLTKFKTTSKRKLYAEQDHDKFNDEIKNNLLNLRAAIEPKLCKELWNRIAAGNNFGAMDTLMELLQGNDGFAAFQRLLGQNPPLVDFISKFASYISPGSGENILILLSTTDQGLLFLRQTLTSNNNLYKQITPQLLFATTKFLGDHSLYNHLRNKIPMGKEILQNIIEHNPELKQTLEEYIKSMREQSEGNKKVRSEKSTLKHPSSVMSDEKDSSELKRKNR